MSPSPRKPLTRDMLIRGLEPEAITNFKLFQVYTNSATQAEALTRLLSMPDVVAMLSKAALAYRNTMRAQGFKTLLDLPRVSK